MTNPVFQKYFGELSNPDLLSEVEITCKFRLPYLLDSGKITQAEYEVLLRSGLANINSQIPLHDPTILYASDKTRQAFEMLVIVERLNRLLPDIPVGRNPRFVKIKFKGDHDNSLSVIYSAGPVVPTGKNDQAEVSERTLLNLRILNMEYELTKSEAKDG